MGNCVGFYRLIGRERVNSEKKCGLISCFPKGRQSFEGICSSTESQGFVVLPRSFKETSPSSGPPY